MAKKYVMIVEAELVAYGNQYAVYRLHKNYVHVQWNKMW